jgi:2-polyprenyl-3-methyl-5-hydroxy-6-metoxy-1,4-benzoquinol methylase
MAYISYMLKYRNIINRLHEPWEQLAKNLYIAIEDAKEYLGISTDEFFEYANLWPNKEETLFLSKKNNDAFYKEWKGDYAKYNICANILNQFNDTINFKAIYNYLPGTLNNNSVVIDYGCGTATLSISLAIENIIKSKILLLDIDNEIKQFVLFRIDKHKLNRNIFVHDVMTFSENNICNALYCIDVLEHINHSSDTLTG